MAETFSEAKKIIAPAGVEVGANSLKIGTKLVKTFFVFSYPRYLGTGWFEPLINLPFLFDISIFVSPVDTGTALKNLRKKSAQIESQITDQQEKGLVRDPVLETALQENYALYQKEFAGQKLALDTLRLRQQVEQPLDVTDFGAFCAQNEALRPKQLIMAGGKISLTSAIGGVLEWQTPAKAIPLLDSINLYNGAATVILTTTSVPHIALLSIKSATSVLTLHYIDTKAGTVTSIDNIYEGGVTVLTVTDTKRTESVINSSNHRLTVVGGQSYAVEAPSDYTGHALTYGGIDASLSTVYFTFYTTIPDTEASISNPFAFNLKTKKIIPVNEFKNLLE